MKQTVKGDTKKVVTKVRKKMPRVVPAGIAHVQASFNNTIITVTDLAGNVVTKSSAGETGYKGSRKSSGFAAQTAAQKVAHKAATTVQMKELEVNLSGPGAGREPAVRGFIVSGLNVTAVRDVTPVAFNGCKPRKRRRV